jgi:ABC-type Na+ transport system ATPase subunit NatA
VEQVADHVTMIAQGKVVLGGELASLKQSREGATLADIFFAHVGKQAAEGGGG